MAKLKKFSDDHHYEPDFACYLPLANFQLLKFESYFLVIYGVAPDRHKTFAILRKFKPTAEISGLIISPITPLR